jgi:hypothetical protein
MKGPRYIVQPKTGEAPYKFQVLDTLENKAVAYTVTRSQAYNYAEQMNERGFIEP